MVPIVYREKSYGHTGEPAEEQRERVPGRRTRVEQLRRVSFRNEGETVEAKFLPPPEVDSGQVPSDGVAVHVNTARLQSSVLDAINRFDQDSVSGEAVMAKLNAITAPDYWRSQLANGYIREPLIWETDDLKYTGHLEARFTVVQADFEHADQVAIGDAHTSTTGVSHTTSVTTTDTSSVGGRGAGSGAEGNVGYQHADAESSSDGATTGGSVTRSTAPTASARFKLHLQWDGILYVKMTPKSTLADLMPVPTKALARSVNVPFSFRDTAIVRFPLARCRPLAQAVK